MEKLVDVSHVNDYDKTVGMEETRRGSLMASVMLWSAPRLICSLIKAPPPLSLSLSLSNTHARSHSHSFSVSLNSSTVSPSISLFFSLSPSLRSCRSHTLVCYPLIAAIIFSEFDINAIQPGCRPKVPSGSPVAEKDENELIDG